MKRKFDLQKAQQLRKEGMTYKEIATELGCSMNWCEKYLKGTVPRKRILRNEISEEVGRRGMSVHGVTDAEIRNLVRTSLPQIEMQDKDQKQISQAFSEREKLIVKEVQAIKRVVRVRYPEVVIRPYWMVPTDALGSLNTMCDLADRLHQYMNDLGREFREQFDLDESFHKSVVHELSRLAVPNNSKLVPQGIMVRAAQLGRVADRLGERNGKGTTAKSTITTETLFADDLPKTPGEQPNLPLLSAQEDQSFQDFLEAMSSDLEALPEPIASEEREFIYDHD